MTQTISRTVNLGASNTGLALGYRVYGLVLSVGGSVTELVLFPQYNDAEGQPADVALASADGTSVYMARRDHVHVLSAPVIALFAPAAHAHAGEDITSGTVADARIASTITRDSEVFGIVLAADGSGSGLDADLLRGTTPTAFGLSLIDDAAAVNGRATLGLVIGTDVQAQDAELAAIAGLVSAADQLPYFTGSGTAALVTFTAAGRALIDDADATAQRTTLGLGTIATEAEANYLLLAGRAGGTTGNGGNAANDDLILHGTSHATRTTSYILLQPTAGNVGIANSAPVALLHVGAGIDTPTTASPALVVQQAGATALAVRDATNDVEVFASSGAAGGFIGTATNHSLFVRANNDTKMTVLASGNVGIANTNPGALLHVGAGTDATVITPTVYVTAAGTSTIVVRDSTNNIEGFLFAGSSLFLVGSATNHEMHLRTNNVSRIYITTGGSVGINEATPDGQLDVAQTSTTAAIPTLELEQADLSEELINFVATIGSGNPIEADTSPPANPTHKVRCALNGSFVYIYVYGS